MAREGMAMSAFVMEHHPAKSSFFIVIAIVPPRNEYLEW
jgi:hypothetical protein